MKKIKILFMISIILFSNVCFAQTENDKQNTNLSILRLNYVGISPSFQKDVKQYYFIADSSIENIEITVVPENTNATVTITGNTNLIMGKNTITIHIISEDKSTEEDYFVYVTRTQNVETANANLENLAAKQGMLTPEFDKNICTYTLEVENEIENIDILAIPEKQNATVTIEGNDNIKVGDNTIKINVLAEDGITNKEYEITVHRLSTEESQETNQSGGVQAEKMSATIEKEENGKLVVIIEVVVILLGIIFIAYLIYYELKKYRKK
jgi:hypothetical protein